MLLDKLVAHQLEKVGDNVPDHDDFFGCVVIVAAATTVVLSTLSLSLHLLLSPPTGLRHLSSRGIDVILA